MTEKTARDLWDARAASRLKFMQTKKMARFNALYENACWRFIEPLLPVGGGRILEAGCGTGRWVYRLVPLGHRVVLSDFSPEMVRIAFKQIDEQGVSDGVEACHVLDICDMHTLADESFDMALALGTPVGLCDNPHKAVAELYRVVKQGGFLFCDVTNQYRRALDLAKENNWAAVAEILDSGKKQTNGGFVSRSFTPEKIRELFTACGLKVLHVAAVCPFLSFPPSPDQVTALEDDAAYAAAKDIFYRFAETPEMIHVSTRLLIAGRKI